MNRKVWYEIEILPDHGREDRSGIESLLFIHPPVQTDCFVLKHDVAAVKKNHIDFRKTGLCQFTEYVEFLRFERIRSRVNRKIDVAFAVCPAFSRGPEQIDGFDFRISGEYRGQSSKI